MNAAHSHVVLRTHIAPESRGKYIRTLSAALACAFSLVLGAATIAFAGSPATEFQRWNGEAPAAFTLPDTANAETSLASARGQIVLVHFFATWCEPCREELPALNRIAARGNGKIKVLAISVADVPATLRRFLTTVPLDFPVLLDGDRAVAKAWHISTLPSTVVLDADLKPRLLVESDFAWDTLDPAKLVKDLTAQPASQKPSPLGG